MNSLTGQVAVVTGAASGIGRSIVDAFTAEGAWVLAADLSVLALEVFAGRELVFPMEVDVTDSARVEAMVDAAVGRWGHIDILCNNAGAPDRCLGVDECPDEDWDNGLALHLTAPFVASRRALPYMLAAGRGLIINTVSTAGLTGGNGGVAYTASKHGLVGLSRSIAAFYGPEGVRCIAMCPGAVDTGATALMSGRRERGELSARSEVARARTFKAFIRRAKPDEFGALALYLAAGGADLLNGAVLTANSGYSAY